MSLLDTLPHRVTIRSPIYGADDLGGVVGEFEDVASDVSAWVQNAGASEIKEFDRRGDDISHKIFFGAVPVVAVGDQIYVESGPSFVGKTFVFVAGTERSAGCGLLWAAYVVEKDARESGR